MRNLTTEEFIKRAKNIHGNKYDYSKVIYVNTETKVCIVCPKHGEFCQIPHSHLSGSGCPFCGRMKSPQAKKERASMSFIEKARKVHGEKYDYSKFKYVDAKTKGIIICPIHGEYLQSADKHIHGSGCRKCSKNEQLTTEEFIERAKEIHGEKYDYSKVEYVNALTKVCIICPIHGEFWQNPLKHIFQKQGCPNCQTSHLEGKIENFLNKNNIVFEKQKHFEWLGKQSLDFYLPQFNCAIECQGEQHFKPIKHFGNEANFLQQQDRDERKYNLCQEHNIVIFYFSEKKLVKRFPFFLGQKLFGSEEELLETIYEQGELIES